MASPARRLLNFGAEHPSSCTRNCNCSLPNDALRCTPICSETSLNADPIESCEACDDIAASAADGALSADVIESFRKLLTVLAGKHALEGGDAVTNLSHAPKAFRDDLHVIKRHWQLLTADKENAPEALTNAERIKLTRIRNRTRAVFNPSHALAPSLCMCCLKLKGAKLRVPSAPHLRSDAHGAEREDLAETALEDVKG